MLTTRLENLLKKFQPHISMSVSQHGGTSGKFTAPLFL